MPIVDTSTRKAALPPIIATRLDEVRRRESSLRLTIGLLDALALFLVTLLAALVIDWSLTLFSTSARAVLTCAALGAGGAALLLLAVVPRFQRRTMTEMAAQVDRSIPGFEERWETATRLSDSSDPQTITGSPVLVERVMAESAERGRFVDPDRVISRDRLRKHRWLLAAVVGAIVVLFVVDPAQTWVLLRRFCAPSAPVSLTEVTAVSGDVAVAKGEPLRLEATLVGRPRDKADFFVRDSQGQVASFALVPSDEKGTQFAHAIEAAEEPFSYRFRAGDGETPWHDVSIYDRPRLTGIELKIQPPDYTRLPAVTKTELPTSLRAVEGSRLEVGFTVDQPLDHFDLQLGDDSAARISPQGTESLRYVFRTKLEKTLRLTPVFVSQHGLSNLRPPSCQVIVYPDKAPDVAIISPEREISLRPNDQVIVEFAARDDFGVARAEIVAFVGEQADLQNVVVLPPQAGNPAQSKGGTSPTRPNAGTKRDAAQTGPQPKQADNTAPSAPNEPGAAPSNPATPAPSAAPGTERKAEAANRRSAASKSAPSQAAPARTVVIPIPLGSQAGEKNVRAKVKLDLKQFQLKQGQQLQYMVRVYDSRNTRSNGQSYGEDDGQTPKSGESMAGGQESKDNQSQATRSSASPESSKETSQKSAQMSAQKSAQKSRQMSQRDRNAKTGKTKPPVPSASRPDKKMAQAENRKSSANRDASRITAKDEKSQAESSQARSASAKNEAPRPEQPSGQMTGAPRPEDAMTRRRLDVDSQSTASSTMKIHIDKWAGSFEGQQRTKLELAIDPVLKELDAVLAKAIEELRPAADALAQAKTPGDDYKKSLRAADTQIARGQSLVADLVQKSDGTPYAFIGLQLVDITELHISPARLDVKAAKADAPDRKDRVQQAAVHLARAREMLADLTRTYESVKRDLRLAEDMQRIKTMYQVFIEDAMIFLSSNRSTLNPKDRKMTQLELDEEFLKQYRELAQEWEKTLAELAKALSKDPRLLSRYMSLSRRTADSLRDQLTLLNLRQQELLAPVQQMTGESAAAAPPADPEAAKPTVSHKDQQAQGAKTVAGTLSRDLAEIAAGTIGVQEDLGTWLPQKMTDDRQVVALREQATKISSLATLAATASANPKQAAKHVDELAAQLKSFESALAKMAESDNAQVAVPLNRRLARVRKLQQLTTAWTEKNAHVAARRFNRALEMDQHRLSEDTLALTGKLESAGAQLAGLPDEVLAMADEVKDAIRYDVLVEQMSAELRLRDGDLPDAKTHQKKAIEGFARAEERFNKLIDRVIEEQDKAPPQVPDLDNMQLPTLEDLLARLESETDLAELLGIPDKPTNLQTLRDWMPNRSGSGSGMMAGARERARLVDQARRDALRNVRKADKSDGRPRPVATAARWNTLGSRLEDAVRQSRGNTPPRQYRRAIERYFELISGAKTATENAPGAAPAKETPKENAGPPGGTTNAKP